MGRFQFVILTAAKWRTWCVPICATWHKPQIVWNYPKPSGFIAWAESCIIFMKGADMRGVLADLPGDGERGYFKALQFAVIKTCLQIGFI